MTVPRLREGVVPEHEGAYTDGDASWAFWKIFRLRRGTDGVRAAFEGESSRPIQTRKNG